MGLEKQKIVKSLDVVFHEHKTIEDMEKISCSNNISFFSFLIIMYVQTIHGALKLITG